MSIPKPRIVIPVAVVLVVAVAASAIVFGRDDTSFTQGPIAPTPTVTSTTMPGVGPVAPLTGLPEPDEGKRNRPVLTVKIDNHPLARPQFGVDKADVIVEEKVEGGLSRFMALFQSQDSDQVGPVRSLRSTDPAYLKPLGGMIAYSGGINPVKSQLSPNGLVDLGADNHGQKYYKRRKGRSYEHSMYTITPVLRELTPKNAAAPKPLFEYLRPGQSFGGVPVASIDGRMADSSLAATYAWTWDGGAGVFRRTTDGAKHEFEGAGQIGMDNVIVQFTPYSATPWRDRANTVVDEAVLTGSGSAWVLSEGKLVKGSWSRPTNNDVTKYTDANGAAVKLKPGHTWVMLVTQNAPIASH